VNGWFVAILIVVLGEFLGDVLVDPSPWGFVAVLLLRFFLFDGYVHGG